MIVALLALFVALGGTATAAKVLITSAQIKDGAVKKPDIGTGAVDSSKVADGALNAKDFDQTTRGLLDQAGARSFEVYRNDGPTDQKPGNDVTIATMKDIPAGAYAFFAKTVLTAPRGILSSDQIEARCKLDVGGDRDEARQYIGAPAALNLQVTRTFSSPGTATLSCNQTGGDKWSATNTTIIAIRVGSPSKVAVDG